jgi:transposase
MEHPSPQDLLKIIEKRDRQIELLMAENQLLRQKVDALVRRVFGISSEKLAPGQLELFGPDSELGKDCASWKEEASQIENHPAPNPAKPAPKRRAERWPEDLPVIEQVLVPEPVQAAPEAWRRIGEEVSEQLDYEPGRFLRRRLVRPKFVPRFELDGVPLIAPLPPMLQERCTAAPGLLSQIIVAKYCDHLPLYRQQQIFKTRHHIELPRQNMARWMGLAADWCRPVYDAIRAEILGGHYVQVDETPIEYLDPGHGSTRQGYLWTAHRPGAGAVYHWETSRAASCLNRLIPMDFHGVVQCDGYSAYPAFARERAGQIELIGCWAHVRRSFFEAQDQAPRVVAWILRQISHLYWLEERLRDQRAGPRWRSRERAAHSRMIHIRLGKALIQLKATGRYLPKSSMGQALDYALGQWPRLGAYWRPVTWRSVESGTGAV